METYPVSGILHSFRNSKFRNSVIPRLKISLNQNCRNILRKQFW
jgi:hypothetical protein